MTSPADVHAAKLAAIEAADDAEESLRERVARAIGEADGAEWDGGMGDVLPVALLPAVRARYRRLADVAIATVCTPVEGAPAGCGAEAACTCQSPYRCGAHDGMWP